MLVKELLRRVRRRLDDATGNASTYLWKDDEIIDEYATDVQNDMCSKTRRLIKDSTTVGEVLATGTITLTGSAGSLTSLTAGGLAIMTGPIAYSVDISTTAAAVAQAVNDYAYASDFYGIKYTAAATLGVITLTARAGSGSTPNGHTIVATATGGLSAAVTTISGGASLCQMYLIDGQAVYEKNQKILEITSAYIASEYAELTRTSEAELKQLASSWRSTEATPMHFVEDLSSIRFVYVPHKTFTVDLTVYRLPLLDLDCTSNTQSPEIPEMYHTDMIPGILQLCFEKNDEETFRPQLAAALEAKFERRCLEIGQEIIMRTGGSSTQSYYGEFQ